MFFKTLNNYVFCRIENLRLKNLFSLKNKPDIILTDGNDIVLALKYDYKTMNAPVIVEKGRNFYAKKLLDIGSARKIPVIRQTELSKELFLNTNIGREIPYKNYEEIAVIYAKNVDFKNSGKADRNNFDAVFEEQRNKRPEVLSIELPHRIQLELGHEIYCIIRHEQIKIEANGFIIQNINITENEKSPNNEFNIKINGSSVMQGNIKFSNITPVNQLKLYLAEVIKKHLKEIMGYDEIARLLGIIEADHPVLVQEISKFYSIGGIRKIFLTLLDQNIPFVNIIGILESIADCEGNSTNIELAIDNIKKRILRSQYLFHLEP